jgi:anti-sigma B factor antagonist
MAALDNESGGATIEGAVDASGTAILRLGGELDMASVPRVEVALEPFLQAAPGGVVFDMSAVAFLDSSGIAMLLRAAERVVRVEVSNPSSPVRLVIRATGLSDVLHVDP